MMSEGSAERSSSSSSSIIIQRLIKTNNHHQCSCSSCPLRLNEASTLTTKNYPTTENSRRRNLRFNNHQSELEGNKQQQIGNNNNSNLVNNNNNQLPKTTMNYQTKTTTHHRHRFSLYQPKHQPVVGRTICHLNNNNNNLILSLLFVICHLLVADQQVLADSTSLSSYTPNYPSPLAAPTTSQQQQVGPSLCPLVSSCQCKWSNGKQGAFCDHRNLQTIPSQLPQDIQVLDMNGNNLVQLQRHIFQDRYLTNLQRIHLVDCKLTYIHDEAFAHLTNLIELDLSRNNLLSVPIRAFQPFHLALRRLSLAQNPIQLIESDSFGSLQQLSTLDLSGCQLSQLKPSSFNGLFQLKDLKLHDNKLTQLPMNVIQNLPDYLIVELFNNPWNCDCELKSSMEWLNRHHVQQSVQPTCLTPQRHKDIRWNQVKADDFLCPPVVLNKQQDRIVGAGSNISLECVARGSQPLTFVWFQDEKNLTTTKPQTANGSTSPDPPSSTKLLEERRYEISEEIGLNFTRATLHLFDLKLTDTSLFLCWVENAAGYTMANFSLIVNDSLPPAYFGSDGTGSELAGHRSNWSISNLVGDGHFGLVSLITVFILISGIILLLLYKKQERNSNRSSKSSQSSNDLKHHTISGSLTASNKFAPPNGGRHVNNNNNRAILAKDDEFDDDDDEEDEDNGSESSQSSSCRKTGGGGSKQIMSAGALDGFIEHMRSGIINMDYHSMSPVIQFNNNNNNNSSAASKQSQSTINKVSPYLDTNNLPTNINTNHLHHHQQAMHHFPSASNASSVAPYLNGQYGLHHNGSASMTTTTSDLSPSSGSSATTTGVGQQQQIPVGMHQHQHQHYQPSAHHQLLPTNCDFVHHQHQQQASSSSSLSNNFGPPPTNVAGTISYASDFNDHDHRNQQQQPPMYYDDGAVVNQPDLYHASAAAMYNIGNNGPSTGMMPNSSMRPAQSSQHLLQDIMAQQQQRLLQQQQGGNQQQQRLINQQQRINNNNNNNLESDRFHIF